MKFSLALLAFAAAASAQVTGCNGKAQACIDKAIADSGVCKAGDKVCGCENQDAIQKAATPCVLEACDTVADALAVAEEAKAACAALGDGGETPAEPTTKPAEPTAAEPTTAEPTAAEPTAAEPTESEPSYEEPTGTTGTGPEPSGESPEEPTPSGDGSDDETPVEAGASAFAPAGALAAALLAFAL